MYGYSRAAHYKNYVRLHAMNNTSDIENILHDLKEDAAVPETFRTNARIRILNTVTSPQPLKLSWYKKPRVFGYTLGTAIATVVLSVGAVYAAQSSLPHSTLYPVKVLSEDVALTLSPTQSLKTSVAATIISRRVTEVETLQKQGDPQAVRESITHLNTDVESIQKRKDISQEKIEQTITEHKDFIDAINKDHEDEIREEVQNKLPGVEGKTTDHKD